MFEGAWFALYLSMLSTFNVEKYRMIISLLFFLFACPGLHVAEVIFTNILLIACSTYNVRIRTHVLHRVVRNSFSRTEHKSETTDTLCRVCRLISQFGVC